MLGILAAIGLILHGLIHLFGFVVPWRITMEEQYSTTLFAGKLDVGERESQLCHLASMPACWAQHTGTSKHSRAIRLRAD